MGISAQGADHFRMKIARAYKHVQEFNDLVVAQCTRPDPYTVTAQDDVVNGRYIIRCAFNPMDQDIPLSLGDVIYNLRSGLDQLAWQLALMGTVTPGRETAFPIAWEDTPKTQEWIRKLTWQMPCDAIAIIQDLQPYKRGNAYRQDRLWQLNELSNIDKHRLPAGRCTDSNIYVAPLGFIKSDFDNGVEFSWPLTEKSSVVFEPRTPTLIFGDPIYNSTNRMPLEVTREDVVAIYNDIRERIEPRFTRFFSTAPIV